MRTTSTLVALTLTLAACGGGGGSSSGSSPSSTGLSSEQRTALVSAITEQQIVPAMTAVHSHASTLNEQVQQWCQAPQADGLTALQQQWRDTANAWYQAQLFNFGPADADPVLPLYTYIDSLRLRGTDYRATVRTTQASWLQQDELNNAFFAEQRFQYVGLLALEEALFYGPELAQQYVDEPKRCDLLTGLSQQLAIRTEALQQGWSLNYNNSGTAYQQLLINNQLPTGRDAMAQLLIAAQEYLDYFKKRNIVTLAGTTAEVSWQLAEQALTAAKQLLTQPYAGTSLLQHMQQQGYELNVNAVNSNIAMAEQALSERDSDSFNAAIGMLDGNFKREIPVALGIELGINFSDGD
ncbi:imelysin family protein [Bacterioplanes sanyensis]|nr:imelysin family protein [Bacterioplanes sanyensis]